MKERQGKGLTGRGEEIREGKETKTVVKEDKKGIVPGRMEKH